MNSGKYLIFTEAKLLKYPSGFNGQSVQVIFKFLLRNRAGRNQAGVKMIRDCSILFFCKAGV